LADQLYRDVETYFEFGVHRTGTEADRRTGEWLHDRLDSSGLDATFHEWTVPQFFLRASTVRVGERRIEAMPYWLPKPTGAEPIRAPLVAVTNESPRDAMAGRIALVDQTWTASSGRMNRFLRDAHEHGALGVVFVSDQPQDPIVAMNSRAPYVEEMQPIPTVVVSRRELAFLSEASAKGAEAALSIEGEFHEHIQARNVIGKIERGPRWIIISTPDSGWHGCAGERGSGIALWLRLAGWAARRETGCSYLFVANSGHELGYIGAEKTLESGIMPEPDETICWLHLGANIGVVEFVREDDSFRRDASKIQTHVMASPKVAPIVRPAVESIAMYGIATEDFIGELVNVREHGYPSFGLIGGGDPFPWFHTDQDTMQSVEGRNLAVIAQAAMIALEAIEADDAALRKP